MRPVVSVALCTRNGERFIGAQLDSILVQSRPVDEVVVSDDASTDETLRIVERVWEAAGERAPALRVMSNATALGVTRNFEQAVSATSGDLIALSDQDDVWAPDKVQVMTAFFESRPTLDLLFTDAHLVDEAGAPRGGSLFDALEIDGGELDRLHAGRGFDVLLRRNIVTGATVMLRRRLLEHALPFEKEWVHDEWLAVIAAAVGDIDSLPRSLIDYRQHGSNEIGVSAPTLRYKVGRVLSERGDRNERLLLKAERLGERLKTLPVSPTVASSIQGKVVHQQRRATLPIGRLLRIPAVIKEARSGRYARFSSQGRLDIIRDILQPGR